MRIGHTVALSAHLRRVIAASFLTLGLAAAAANFAASRSQSRNVSDALVSAVERLSNTAARWEHGADREEVPKREAASRSTRAALGDNDAAAVLENLADGLDALENFARKRPSLADDQLVALISSLLQAVDRLNAIARSVTVSADYVRAAE